MNRTTEEATIDTDSPRVGDTFTHARWFTGSRMAGTAQPVVCTVTRVTKLAVYFDGHYIARDRFHTVVKPAA